MRLNIANFPNLGINVSIHASVKDATMVACLLAQPFNHVSIHASVKDATIRMSFATPLSVFQSTHL